MRHLYLVVLGFGFDRDAVVKYLEADRGTGTWFYSMPFSFFISSSRSANELSALIKARFPANDLRHFVTRVASDRQGWMPKDHWDLYYRQEQ